MKTFQPVVENTLRIKFEILVRDIYFITRINFRPSKDERLRYELVSV